MSSTRFIELSAAVWSNNTVRVMARNISAATFDLAAATLSVGGDEAAGAVTFFPDEHLHREGRIQ